LDLERLNRYNTQLTSITIPILLLWGENDPWIPLSVGRRLKMALPRSTLEVIPRCGHAPQEELPHVTANRILNFIHNPPSN
jgi:pimeloyl-ACP methyl ester carboxylesterase